MKQTKDKQVVKSLGRAGKGVLDLLAGPAPQIGTLSEGAEILAYTEHGPLVLRQYEGRWMEINTSDTLGRSFSPETIADWVLL